MRTRTPAGRAHEHALLLYLPSPDPVVYVVPLSHILGIWDSESESKTGADDLANSQDPDSESETQAGADDQSNSPQESCSEIGAMEGADSD